MTDPDETHRSDLPILVHIGYPKCASSTLQSGLFSGGHKGFAPLPAGSVQHRQSYSKGGETAFFDGQDPLVRSFAPFAYDTKQGRASIRRHMLPLGPGQVAVLSNEGWAGHPFSGGATAGTVARRIKDTLPEARILIVFREQRAMLLSSYAHFLTKGGGLTSLKTYLNPVLETQIPWHNPAYYRFSGLVKHYQDLFGAEHVLALPMEALAQDATGFQAAICRFAGVTPPEEVVASGTSNARDWMQYAVLRRARWINLLGRAAPANGHIGLEALRLRGAFLQFGRFLVGAGRLKRLKDKDWKLIDAHLAEQGIARDNQTLQDLLIKQPDATDAMTDLARFGYMLN